MPVGKWVAPLAIACRFRSTEAEYRARREIFERSISLDPATRISLAEKYSVPTTFIVPTLAYLVRRPEPLLEREIVDLSGEMVARLGVARERCLRQSSWMFAEANCARHREAVVACRGSIDFTVKATRTPVPSIWTLRAVTVQQIALVRFHPRIQHVPYLYATNIAKSYSSFPIPPRLSYVLAYSRAPPHHTLANTHM